MIIWKYCRQWIHLPVDLWIYSPNMPILSSAFGFSRILGIWSVNNLSGFIECVWNWQFGKTPRHSHNYLTHIPLTHCVLETPYSMGELDWHCFMWWFVPWKHKTIACYDIGLPVTRYSGINSKVISNSCFEIHTFKIIASWQWVKMGKRAAHINSFMLFTNDKLS